MPKQNTVFKDAYNRCLKLLVPGESLPSEPELGDLLGVSRTTVRTILFEMVEAGLVDWNHRSKTVRRPPLAACSGVSRRGLAQPLPARSLPAAVPVHPSWRGR